ncbi:1-(5-phosphoribosyl)-5-[(5-phosphoribosylamino)methylideneamino]imidazole-4-carboxamide isomerase [Candidatus Micrarchaeota archaeon]|nr:1-(5-phosphoribosyl)-5-[(5-phosphoribosylamino)methylideneamino]imidazole-4-carboxamide isomerase [Candidatus Micrarchaeota archaeon]
MYIIPAIDIRDWKCVRLLKGDFDKETVFSLTPSEAIKKFQTEGAKIVHIIDLDGARDGSQERFLFIKKLAEEFAFDIQVGGGIRDYATVYKLLCAGAKRVILGTAAVEQPALISQIADGFDSSRIAVSIDVKNRKAYTEGWKTNSGSDPLNIAKVAEKNGAGFLIITAIEKDGTLQGPDYDLIKKIKKQVKIPVIAAGGIGSLADIRQLQKLGLYGAVVGRALYENKISLKEAIECCQKE